MVMRRLVSRMFPSTSGVSDVSESWSSLSQTLLHKRRMVERSHPGGYILNPVVFRALRKLENLIDKHMEAIGAQRIAMPALSPSHLWKKTGRWEQIGSELFKLTDRNRSEMCLAPTHEETVCSMVAIYRDLPNRMLPILLYQITTKFRDEPRPIHGLLRGREFLMKDLYSFDIDKTGAMTTYQAVIEAYEKLFKELQLDVTKVAADTGAIGGSLSHEFHIESAIGEDRLQVCPSCQSAVNTELLINSSGNLQCPNRECSATNKVINGIELGHAFLLGDKYSLPLDVKIKDHNNEFRHAYMGCFGLGVTRILAASVEVLSSATQLQWPRTIAPYKLILIPQKKGHRWEETYRLAETVYDSLERTIGLTGEVVLDDRVNLSIGQRIRHARLDGYPYALCFGKQALVSERPPQLELVDLYSDTSSLLDLDTVYERVKDLS